MAFVSRERWPADSPADREAAWDVIPDLAVEITSPTDLIDDLMDKIDEYFAGVRLVWVIYPKQRKVYAYQSPTSVTDSSRRATSWMAARPAGLPPAR